MSLCDDLELSDGPGVFLEAGTPAREQHQNQGAEPGCSSEQRELEFLPLPTRAASSQVVRRHLHSTRFLPASVTRNTSAPWVASSAQMQRRVLRPSRLDDFWFGSLHSFHLVVLVVVLIALADVDHHARGGVGRRVQFILLP